MLNKDQAIYNSKKKTKTSVEFYKDQIIITAEIESHKDGLYSLVVNGKKVQIKDEDVDKVNPLEDTDTYEFYLVTNMNKLVKDWEKYFLDKYKLKGDDVFTVEKSEYDINGLIDQLFDHGKNGLKKFVETGEADYPYYPLAYIVVMEILNKMYGGLMTILVGTSPMMEVMVLLWLHGYLTSSAIRKGAIKQTSKAEPVPDAELEERRKQLEEVMEKISEEMKKWAEEHKDDGGDDGDKPEED